MGTALFGEGLRLAREARGLTQSELASRIRVRRRRTTHSYISRIENGLIDPRLSTVVALARALQMKPWQLLAYPENSRWWDAYLSIPGERKREIQRLITWRHER
jgi:transcriptional regulator with XRE-family HTH domain